MLISNGLSTMGFALPAAIGAALLDRDRPVVALTGDGGLLMCAGELLTAARERLRIIVDRLQRRVAEPDRDQAAARRLPAGRRRARRDRLAGARRGLWRDGVRRRQRGTSSSARIEQRAGLRRPEPDRGEDRPIELRPHARSGAGMSQSSSADHRNVR